MSNTPNAPRKPKVANRTKTLDLDALEKGADVPKPLPVRLGGKEFIFTDYDELDWRELQRIRSEEDIDEQLRAMLGDQYETFAENTVPMWKITELLEQLDEHFGWTKRMGSQGESDASSTS